MDSNVCSRCGITLDRLMLDRLNSETLNSQFSNVDSSIPPSRTTDNNYDHIPNEDDWLTEDEFVIKFDGKKRKKAKKTVMRTVMNTLSGHRSAPPSGDANDDGDKDKIERVDKVIRDQDRNDQYKSGTRDLRKTGCGHHNKYRTNNNNHSQDGTSDNVIGNRSESSMERKEWQKIELLQSRRETKRRRKDVNEERKCCCCCPSNNRYLNKFNDLIISIASIIILLPITTTFLLISRTCD